MSERRRLIHRLLADERVQKQIGMQAQRTGEPLLKVESTALKYLDTLCADFSPTVVERLYPLFSLMLQHLYPDIEVQGLDRLHSLATRHRLVYLPAHRSHVDYMLISWALYRDGLALPHIAAGDNLDLPLIGPILRRGGAVFMRRRFLDDPLYTCLFQRYLEHLLRQEPAYEFFIEGGRSRTGRLLPAKLGLLRMILDAWQTDDKRPLALIPLSINYDRCVENSRYQRELAGDPKKPESLLGVLAAASNLLQRGGGVYLRVGEPVLLGPDTPTPPVEQLADRMQRLNNAAAIATPMARLAGLLARNTESGTTRAELILRYERLTRLIHHLGAALPRHDPDAAEAISAAVRRHQISLHRGCIILGEGQAAGLCFYRNNLSHLLALPGLMLLLATRLPNPSKSTITRLLRALLPFLDAELHLPEFHMERGMERDMERSALSTLRGTLAAQGLLEETATHLHPTSNPLTRILIDLAEPILLRQYLLIRVLKQQPIIGESQLLELVGRLAGHIHPWYGHQAPDYADKRQLGALVEQLVQSNLLRREEKQVYATRALDPIIRIGYRLLPGVLLQESERWLKLH